MLNTQLFSALLSALLDCVNSNDNPPESVFDDELYLGSVVGNSSDHNKYATSLNWFERLPEAQLSLKSTEVPSSDHNEHV